MAVIPLTFWSISVQAIDVGVVYNGPVPSRPRDYYHLVPLTHDLHYVYVLANERDAALYVGRSWRPGNRFDAHKRREWWSDVCSVVILQVRGSDHREARAIADWLETYAIRRLRPAHNIAKVAV